MEKQFRDLGIHPQYLTKLLRFLWYVCHSYYIAIEVHASFLLKNVKELGQFPCSPNFNRFFLWFDDLQTWKTKLEVEFKDYLANS